MNFNIIIRRAKTADSAELAVLNKQLIEDEAHDNPMTIPELEARMAGFLSDGYDAYFCLDGGARVVGYALINMAAKPLYLRQFFICRGERRKGYGKEFFTALLEHLNITTLDIEVLSWNEAGVAFWESLGFKRRSIYMRLERG